MLMVKMFYQLNLEVLVELLSLGNKQNKKTIWKEF
jgi:hypothetical protein